MDTALSFELAKSAIVHAGTVLHDGKRQVHELLGGFDGGVVRAMKVDDFVNPPMLPKT